MGSVRDVEKDFEDLDDALGGLQRNGWRRGVQHALVLLLPPHLQAALQGGREDGDAAVLREELRDR